MKLPHSHSVMKKFFIILALGIITTNAFSQNVIKFLGIPVDGTKKEMIAQLKDKGYEYDADSDVLLGEFNGTDVIIAVQTVNNRVWRIAVSDYRSVDEANIKIRYNQLFEQLSNNGKYKVVKGSKLKESEDISFEMTVHSKRYDATFAFKDKSINGIVWYTIIQQYGTYRIAMFYENLDNAANGDDL